ncbi:MAG: LysR family transcriptional regulator [Rhizobiales bacterium]|nr:LysR family transcriptional regulator [Hyphomicrobiales bacterium]
MAFKFRQLQYFVAVADTGSISGAAQQLSVSQSTVTEAVKELEADLGVVLIERSHRGMALTRAGQLFLRRAERVLEAVADARRSLGSESEVTGRLSLGVTALVAGYVLSDLLARFRRAHPAVDVTAMEDTADHVEHLLINGELDVAVMIIPERPVDPALRMELLGETAYRVWLPQGHRLASMQAVPLAELAEEPHVMLSVDEIEQTTRGFWREQGFRPRIAFRTRSVEAVRSLVGTGGGVAVMPDLVYRPWSLEGDRIEARPTVEAPPAVRTGIVWRRGSDASLPARDFIALSRTHRPDRRNFGFSDT